MSAQEDMIAAGGALEVALPVTASLVAACEQAIEQRDPTALREAVEGLHAADLADLVEELKLDERGAFVALLGERLDADFLSYIDETVRDTLLVQLEPDVVARLIAQLDSDDAVYALEDLDAERREDILSRMPRTDRRLVEEGLAYREDSAGRLMQREFVAAPAHRTVGETIDRLRADPNLPDIFHDVWVVDPLMRPLGHAALHSILRTKRPVRIGEIMTAEPKTIPVGMDQEEVAHLFRQYGLVEAAVVDDAGRMVGVITHDDVMEIIDEEAEEDLLKLGGVKEAHDDETGVFATARSRFVWLLLNLLTAVLASAVIAMFESTIDAVVVLAVLMPIVASMGGNAGTQALTVAVRALAMKEARGAEGWRLVGKETLVGVLNGAAFALVAGGLAYAWAGEPMIAVVIAVAMVVNLIVAGLSGAAIPIMLQRLGVDPAVASTVFVTTVTDVVGFFVFLGLAAAVLL